MPIDDMLEYVKCLEFANTTTKPLYIIQVALITHDLLCKTINDKNNEWYYTRKFLENNYKGI